MHYKKPLYTMARFLRLISNDKYDQKMKKYGDYNTVKNSILFDCNYYLTVNPEVAWTKIDPVNHYLQYGWKDNLPTSKSFDREKYAREVLKNKKINPILHFEKHKKKINITAFQNINYDSAAAATDKFMISQLHSTKKINIFFIKTAKKRINLILDSLNEDSFFGGVGTACLLASAYASEYGHALRIITRRSLPNAKRYYDFMKLMGEKIPENTDFYSDFDLKSNFRLEVSQDDIFIASSWWSANSLINSGIKSFFYLIQEVETFFYGYGDIHLMCSNILENKNIKFIVNSSNLYGYFKKNSPAIAKNGVFFEPAFGKTVYSPKSKKTDSKFNLFFYARPENPRNLYHTGLNILEKAISSGILDTDKWNIYFAGSSSVMPLKFSNGFVPELKGIMTWREYAELLGNTDLGMALMYTPHSGYPALDILACGGVSVTNNFPGSQKIKWSDNMILCELNEQSLIEGLKEGLKLAENKTQRELNYNNSNLPSSWSDSFKNVLVFMRENK